ncbi:MAG: hypothetical protein ACOYMA_10725 [Bacteroidia bacterium]
MNDKIRKTENLHIVFWLVKDMFWMLEFKAAGAFMILPTLAMAFYVTYLSSQKLTTILVNTAIIFWILANSAWMMSDFYFNIPKSVSLIFFIAGLATILIYIWLAFIKPIIYKKLH